MLLSVILTLAPVWPGEQIYGRSIGLALHWGTLLPDPLGRTAQWQGLVAPAGTPPDVVAKINAELNRTLQLPDVKERIGALGVEFAPTTPQELDVELRADLAKWTQLVKTLGISLD